jgi:5-methylcytosine-specific restriction enzyme subunit McrC
LDVTGLPLDVDRLLRVRARDLSEPQQKDIPVFTRAGASSVRVGGRVGVVEVDGVVIEILPKVNDGETEADRDVARQTLSKMVRAYLEVSGPPSRAMRRLDPARLDASRGPIGERVYELFLHEAEAALQKGVRSGYSPVREGLPYLRGRLDVGRQARQLPVQQHRFNVAHRRFDANRPENRLIKTALERVGSRSLEPARRMRARQLAAMLDGVPTSNSISADLASWDRGRLLAHYQPVEPWCRLVLEPMIGTRQGADHADALLWRTDRLFEMVLEMALRRRLQGQFSGWQLVLQGSQLATATPTSGPGNYLGRTHDGKPAFLLKPDFRLLEGEQNVAVLDAKWKVATGDLTSDEESLADLTETHDQDDVAEPSLPTGTARISASDVYQLHAYGHVFLKGEGVLVVFYPATPALRRPGRYTLNEGKLTLWALPYDIVNEGFLVGPSDTASTNAAAAWQFLASS